MSKRNDRPAYVKALECAAERCPDWVEGGHCGHAGKVKISAWGGCSHFTANSDGVFRDKFKEWWDEHGGRLIE